MQLTKPQLIEIKNFISKKGIKYMDVQMEIVDHVASAVEERMAADQSLNFEQALKQTHASFGVFGFGGVEDAIVNGMSKKYNRIFWKHFLSFFGIKYILLVIFGGVLLYQVQLLIDDYFYLVTFSLFAIVALMGILVVLGLRYKGYKNFLVYQTSAVYLMFIGSFLQIFNVLINKNSEVLIFGVNRNFVIVAILMILYILYIVSAIRTAIVGIKESKLLLYKYKLLNI